MSGVCLNQVELAAGCKISHRTPERWRWAKQGPRYLKLGGRVGYWLTDVEAFEREVQSVMQKGRAGS